MSETNGTPPPGIIKIDRKGSMLVQFGDAEPFRIDVVAVYNAWRLLDRNFRDAEGIVPPERLSEYNAEAHAFVRDVSKMEDLSMAEALEFVTKVGDEVSKLRDFFTPKVTAERSSRESIAVTSSE